MPLVQAIIPDSEAERLEQYRRSLPWPPTKTAVLTLALREWLDARETEADVSTLTCSPP